MKQLTCIVCSNGCRITVERMDREGYICYGNKCGKGDRFARNEMTDPVRSLTTTVRTIYPNVPVLPVKTRGEVPKDKIYEIMRELSKVIVRKNMRIGDIVAANVSRTGCDIIATKNLL